ncbi:hypothetical protein ACR6C2_37055 [Streptomyces sp. INA 01156]
MPFAEWFHRYPAGEETSGPGSGLFRPGPIPLDGMPTDETASASGRDHAAPRPSTNPSRRRPRLPPGSPSPGPRSGRIPVRTVDGKDEAVQPTLDLWRRQLGRCPSRYGSAPSFAC